MALFSIMGIEGLAISVVSIWGERGPSMALGLVQQRLGCTESMTSASTLTPTVHTVEDVVWESLRGLEVVPQQGFSGTLTD